MASPLGRKIFSILIFGALLIATPAVLAARKTQPSSQSQSQSAKSLKDKSGVSATVTSDGAIVYVSPDQDSSVIVMLPVGQKVQVSKNTTGGAEKFHKIRVKTKEGNRIGYISAIDIEVGDGSSAQSKAASSKKDKGKKAARKKPERERRHEEMYFSRFVGLLVGISEYKESINHVDASTTFPIYGLKITGPDVILGGGTVMDFNLALHYGAPQYYEKLTPIRPTGFVLFMDPELLVPFLHNENSMAYLGLGPLLVLSKFSVLSEGRNMDLTSLNFGGAVELGGAFRFSKVAIRLEAKYYIEKQSYKLIQLAIQNEF